MSYIACMAIVACSQSFYWDDFSCICAPCEAVCESGYVEKEGNQHCMELCPDFLASHRSFNDNDNSSTTTSHMPLSDVTSGSTMTTMATRANHTDVITYSALALALCVAIGSFVMVCLLLVIKRIHSKRGYANSRVLFEKLNELNHHAGSRILSEPTNGPLEGEGSQNPSRIRNSSTASDSSGFSDSSNADPASTVGPISPDGYESQSTSETISSVGLEDKSTFGRRSPVGHENPKRPRYLSTQSSGFSECSYSNEEEGTDLENGTTPSTQINDVDMKLTEAHHLQRPDPLSAIAITNQSDINTSSASRDHNNQSKPGNLASYDNNNVSFQLQGSHVQGLETDDTQETINRCVASCKKKDGLKRISEELTV